MKEFLMIFRSDNSSWASASPEQLQVMMKQWMDWIGSIAAQNKLANPGNRLAASGKTVRQNNVITDGPYVEIKEAIGGYIIVKANHLDEAAELATGCPIFHGGGNVEVREIVDMNS